MKNKDEKDEIKLPTEDEIAAVKLRKNIGPPCPLCHMPGKRFGRQTNGGLAYYRCSGFLDPETKIKYPGCGHSFKEIVWTLESAAAAIENGNADEVTKAAKQKKQGKKATQKAVATNRKKTKRKAKKKVTKKAKTKKRVAKKRRKKK